MTLSERIQYLVYWTVKYMYEIKLVPLVFQCIKVLSEVVTLFWQKKEKKKKKVNYKQLFLMIRDLFQQSTEGLVVSFRFL